MAQIAGGGFGYNFLQKIFSEWKPFYESLNKKKILVKLVKRTDLDFVRHTRSDVNAPLHRVKVTLRCRISVESE